MIEEWRPVTGYEGAYEVSSRGAVRSLDRIVSFVGTARGDFVKRLKGRVLKQIADKDGYLHVVLSKSGIRKTQKVHHLVLKAFWGDRPPGTEGCHNNGNNQDNRIENLRWGTPKSNMADAVEHGVLWNQAKTECPRGHELKAPNLVPSTLAKGHRECLACKRARSWIAYHGSGDWQTISDRYFEAILATSPTSSAPSDTDPHI